MVAAVVAILPDRHYFRALVLYVVERPAKANSVLELQTCKARLWFAHFFAFSPAAADADSRIAFIRSVGVDSRA